VLEKGAKLRRRCEDKKEKKKGNAEELKGVSKRVWASLKMHDTGETIRERVHEN